MEMDERRRWIGQFEVPMVDYVEANNTLLYTEVVYGIVWGNMVKYEIGFTEKESSFESFVSSTSVRAGSVIMR